MPKRPAPAAAAAKSVTKRPRADVHPIQVAFAGRVPDAPGVIVAPMGTGKPRVAGKVLDRIGPRRVAALDEGAQGVLTIVVPTDRVCCAHGLAWLG